MGRVIFPSSSTTKSLLRALRSYCEAEAAARRAGVACETLHVKDKFAAAGIIETARDHGCDMIVMSSHGRRGLTRLLLGSQANKVVTLSTVPVLICR
jgi:nucleotide-binding universal stress UspA family protein